jgi:hypothetical protein
MHISPVARKESAGRIPGKSIVYRKHVSSRTCASAEYGHEKAMAFFRATFSASGNEGEGWEVLLLDINTNSQPHIIRP